MFFRKKCCCGCKGKSTLQICVSDCTRILLGGATVTLTIKDPGNSDDGKQVGQATTVAGQCVTFTKLNDATTYTVTVSLPLYVTATEDVEMPKAEKGSACPAVVIGITLHAIPGRIVVGTLAAPGGTIGTANIPFPAALQLSDPIGTVTLNANIIDTGADGSIGNVYYHGCATGPLVTCCCAFVDGGGVCTNAQWVTPAYVIDYHLIYACTIWYLHVESACVGSGCNTFSPRGCCSSSIPCKAKGVPPNPLACTGPNPFWLNCVLSGFADPLTRAVCQGALLPGSLTCPQCAANSFPQPQISPGCGASTLFSNGVAAVMQSVSAPPIDIVFQPTWLPSVASPFNDFCDLYPPCGFGQSGIATITVTG